MHTVIQQCPICKQPLEVTKLHCRTCDTQIEGHFTLGRFHTLSAEQLQFAEIFIRCEGKINRVEDVLHISYPTVRARLHELIRAMGYDVETESTPSAPTTSRQAILDEVANGRLSVEEATAKLAK